MKLMEAAPDNISNSDLIKITPEITKDSVV